MIAYPFTASATLLVLVVYTGFGVVVSRARGTYGVTAPAVTGNADFERRYRVQMNTLEILPILLPLMWLCAASMGDMWAGLGGLVWSIGRVIYARAYYVEAAKRDLGYAISSIPIAAMFVAVIVALATHWA